MKFENSAILAALGVGGFLLYKSKILDGLGDIAGGAGVAATGVGSGIGEIGQAAGDIGTGFAAGVNSVLSLLNPLGALGTEVGQNITARGDISESSLRREAKQSEQVDVQSFEKSNPILSNIQTETDIFSANQSSLRSKNWEETKTSVQENVLDWATSATSLQKYNPFGILSSWVSSVSKSIRTPKIDNSLNVVSAGGSSTTSQTSSIRSSAQSSGSSGSSFSFGMTDAQQATATTLKIPLKSTPFGVVADVPRYSPAPKKPSWLRWVKPIFRIPF